MANEIPDGLTLVKSVKELKEKELASFEVSKAGIAEVISILRKKETNERISKGNAWSKEDERRQKETAKGIQNLLHSLNEQKRRWDDERKVIVDQARAAQEAGATEAEVLAQFKKNSEILMKGTEDFQTELKKLSGSIRDLVEESKGFSGEERIVLRKALENVDKSTTFSDDSKKRDLILHDLNDQVKGLFVESKKSRITELEQLRITQEREKREKGQKKKGTLLTALLGPMRLFTDPLLKAITDKTTEEFITDKLLSADKDRQNEEDKSIEQRNRIADLVESANEKLSELGPGRIENVDISGIRDQALNESEQQFIDHERLMLNLMNSMPDNLTAREKEEAKEISNRRNIDRILGGIAGPAGETIVAGREKKRIEDDMAEHIQYIRQAETPLLEIPPSEMPVLTEDTAPVENIAPELDENIELSEENSLLNKISPDKATLIAKGGVIGAAAVYLGKMLGDQFDEISESQNKQENGVDIKKAIDFFKKNGPSIAKVALPFVVIAAGGAMVMAGMKMQKRDTEDAKKYFEEGNTARGVETALLGDRSRLTEENANRELGRTTGKAALLAGGTAAIGVGTAGVAGMGAAIAGAGGIAAAGGLGAVGTAGLTAMGAAFPPALIGAAVVVGATIIAKGTQEAFELGWDKEQANIQKELNATIFSDDATMWEQIKASGASTWKSFTGTLAGGIREAGKVLDAETMLQQEKQLNFLKEQAAEGNEDYGRLLALMQDEKFKIMSEADQEMMMKAEGVFDDYRKMKKETSKTPVDHLQTIGRTILGFASGASDTFMEGERGRQTALWEAQAVKGLENLSGSEHERLEQSETFLKARENGKNEYEAKKEAYLEEERAKAVARGDLREDGMAIQEGNWLAGMAAGAATGSIPGAIAGALGGAVFGKYLGFGDTGMAYKKKQSDEEYRQTFEYSEKKAELIGRGMSAEEADLAAIEEQNALYEQAMTLRLKQSKDYKKEFDKQLKEGKSIKQAEESALRVAKENKRNTMATTELVKEKFSEMGETLGNWAKNIGGFFKDKFSEVGDDVASLNNMIKEGAQGVWNAVSDWFSGIWHGIGDKVKGALGEVGEGWDWLKGRAGEGLNWFTGLFSGEDDSSGAHVRINDGIVTKNGQVVEVSPDDNIYATKNEFRNVRDREAQAAMPDIPKNSREFTDAGIIAAIQVLTDVLRNKEIAPAIISPGESINFDQFRMADALI